MTGNSTEGEKAGGHKTVLFCFTVKVHVNATCPTLSLAFFSTSICLRKNLWYKD